MFSLFSSKSDRGVEVHDASATVCQQELRDEKVPRGDLSEAPLDVGAVAQDGGGK